MSELLTEFPSMARRACLLEVRVVEDDAWAFFWSSSFKLLFAPASMISTNANFASIASTAADQISGLAAVQSSAHTLAIYMWLPMCWPTVVAVRGALRLSSED